MVEDLVRDMARAGARQSATSPRHLNVAGAIHPAPVELGVQRAEDPCRVRRGHFYPPRHVQVVQHSMAPGEFGGKSCTL
jgi:hypothetical protein